MIFQPFLPADAIPSMKNLCKKMKIIITGRIVSIDAAICAGTSTLYCPFKYARPIVRVYFVLSCMYIKGPK